MVRSLNAAKKTMKMETGQSDRRIAPTAMVLIGRA
jgi:hypothetical protein